MPAQIAPVVFSVPESHRSRQYRLITLSNGLKALLISDPAEDVAAAALSIAAGSFCDPPEIAGLAHLCEHLLFLGTKEFPDPRTYFGTITAAGGSFNAHTTGEETCFYFEVPVTSMEAGKINSGVSPEHRETLVFEYVLRNFSSFFKEPLFSENGVKQEVSTVHEEHTSNITSSSKIFYHALKLLANPLHPFSRFATGTYSTLHVLPKAEGISVKNRLVAYYDRCYSSENMVLTIRGPQSLNHLQKLVGANFSDIPRTRSKRLSFAKRTSKRASMASVSTGTSHESTRSGFSHIPVFTRNNLNKCLYVNSANASQIRLVFPIVSLSPSIDIFKRAWISILGSESKTSLCAYLIKEEDLATAITAFKQSLSWEEEALIIEIEITKKGAKQLETVLIAIFSYIKDQILGASLEEISRYFREMSLIEKAAFENSEINPSASAEVLELAETFRTAYKIGYQNLIQGFIPLEEHLSEKDSLDLLAEEFKKATERVLSIDNFNLLVIHPAEEAVSFLLPEQYLWHENVLEYLHDEHYLFDYQILPINPLALYTKTVEKKLVSCCFPQPNIFLSRTLVQFEMAAKKSNNPPNLPASPFGYTTKKQLDPNHKRPPQLVDFSENHELWFAQDTSSKTLVTFLLRNSTLRPSPRTKIAIELICELIGEELRYELYPGELLGLHWGIFPGVNSTCSFYFTICGFTNGLDTQLELIIGKIKLIMENLHSTTYQTLKRGRLAVRRKIEAFLKMNGRDIATATSYVFLEEKVWTLEERFNALEECSLEDLALVSERFLRLHNHVSVFVQGDLCNDQVGVFYDIVKGTSFCSQNPQSLTPISEPSSYLLPSGKEFVYQTRLALEHRANTILFYTQLGRRADPKVRTLGALFGHMLSTVCIDEFRNARQIGYHVYGGPRLLREAMGLEISLTSGNHNTAFLKRQICEFLYDWEVLLYNYSEEEFKENVIRAFENTLLVNHEKAKNAALMAEPIKGSSVGLQGEGFEIHRSQWEKIMAQTYLFNGQDIDTALLDTLTKDAFYNYFKKHISIKSGHRASLVLAFESNFQGSKEREAFKQRIFAVSETNNLGISLNQAGELADTYQGNINISDEELHRELKGIQSNGSKGSIFGAVGRAFAASIMAAKHGRKGNSARLLLEQSNKKIIREFGKSYSTKKPSLSEVVVTSAGEVHQNCTLSRDVSGETQYERLAGIFQDQDEGDDYIDIFNEYSTM